MKNIKKDDLALANYFRKHTNNDPNYQFFETKHQEYKNYKYPKFNFKHTDFEFLTQNPRLQPIKRTFSEKDKKKKFTVEATMNKIQLQKGIYDFDQKGLTKQDFLKKYSSQNSDSKHGDYLRTMTRDEIENYRKKQIRKLDERITNLNQISLLQEQWQSPFLEKKVVIRVNGSEQDNKLKKSEKYNEGEFFREDEDQLVVTAIQLNKILKGYGQYLKTVIDKNKGEFFKEEAINGNPKYMYRGDHLVKLKNIDCKCLNMIKEWNLLISMEQLYQSNNIFKLQTSNKDIEAQKNFGTITSNSQFHSIQDFHQKISTLSKQASSKQKRSAQQQGTPISQITPLPQFVVRNQSNSSSRKDLIQLEKIQQKADQQDKINEQKISKETFLTYCASFWELIRKEDMIVERIAWAISNKNKSKQLINFENFKKFYKIFVFQQRFINK